jgi:hypothetical protein
MNGGEPMLLLIFYDRRASFRMFLTVAVSVVNAGLLESTWDRIDWMCSTTLDELVCKHHFW